MRNIIRLVASIALAVTGLTALAATWVAAGAPAVGAVTCDHPESGWWTGTWTSTEHSYGAESTGTSSSHPAAGVGITRSQVRSG